MAVRRIALGLAVAFVFVSAAAAQPAPAPARPATAPAAHPAAPARPRPAPAASSDPFTVSAVHVDATGASVTAARDAALAQGRPIAWTRLYHSLAPQGAWPKQPQLNDFQLQHIIRSYEVANERSSNTRYIADVTYVFSPSEVRKLLRTAGAPLAEAGARPVLIIPLIAGHFDPNGGWARAWADPSIGSLLPMVFPHGDSEDNALIARGNYVQLTWDNVASLAKRYDVSEVVIAEATANGQQARLTELWPPVGRVVDSIAVARPDFALTARTAAMKLADSWRGRSSVDYGAKLRLVANVEFSSPADWARIRAHLALVKIVTSYEVNGISTREAQVRMVHYGRADQLAAALSTQQLDLITEGQNYRLRLHVGPPATPQDQTAPVTP